MKSLLFLLLAIFLIPENGFTQVTIPPDTGSFSDSRDNRTYKWIKIGKQIWMKENLNFVTAKGSFSYNSDSVMYNIYGKLYDWTTAKKVCPSEWHLPTHSEWKELADFLGDQAGEKLKEPGSKNWQGPDAVVRGESGFNALPAGCHGDQGRLDFSGLGAIAFFWSATTATPPNKAWLFRIHALEDEINPLENWKVWGYSVRCVKNQQ